MEFSRVIGNVDQKIVNAAEYRLSQLFLEMGLRYDNTHAGSEMGGDPFIFGLMCPVKHVCTVKMKTAATDGLQFYWNPNFVLKQNMRGLRIIAAHEAWHAIYMHPARRGSRNPKLWNIAVDYIVNGNVMEDFANRKMDPKTEFVKNLGKYMTLPEYAQLIKDPFKKQKDFEELDPYSLSTKKSNVPEPDFDDDAELTPEQKKVLEDSEKRSTFFYADPDLGPDFKRPEAIYDYLYALLPKCPECGSLGIYKKPKKDKSDKSESEGGEKDKSEGSESGDEEGKDKSPKDKNHDHGDGEKCDCPNHDQGDSEGQGEEEGEGQGEENGEGQGGCGHGCQSCGAGGDDGIDIFDLGGTVDDHLDSKETEEKVSKRIMDAMDIARRMAGFVPAAMEDELGKLLAPKMTWKDVIRGRILKSREGNDKNDWSKFKVRPMFAGLMVPKRKSYRVNFGCLLDTSGSMSKDDMAFGISQLQSLDSNNEGTIVFADCEIYYDQAVKIKKCDKEALSNLKPVGRGGTHLTKFFEEYEEKIGKVDFIIMITDGYLTSDEMTTMVDPGVPVYWLITSECDFRPAVGKVYNLRDK